MFQHASLLSKPLKIDARRTIYDEAACATFTEAFALDDASPWVIGTQLRFNSTPDGGSAPAGIAPYSVDTVATTTGDWLFNASRSMQLSGAEDWGPIPLPEDRDARDYLQAAADAYLDLWGNSSAPVPWGSPCRRMEGSVYTGSGAANDSCAVGIPQGNYPPNSDRRYVVDETLGAVSVLCKFETMRDAPDSHEFRIVKGKLRYVHTMTVMRSLKAGA